MYVPELKIYPKKITCISGKSGSGKTTLLKLLNQIISHDEGWIYYGNKPIEEYDPINLRRQVTMLPQRPLIIQGTVKENLNLGLIAAEKEPENNNTLKEILNYVKLDKPLDANAESLSGGEKQRIGLARLLLLDPDILLLDEPTSAIDEELENDIIDNLVKCVREKLKTIVMVSHRNEIVNKIADNTLIIKEGHVYEQIKQER